ncbi:hypothetical protein [Cesiribacter andamanensis]|uniref:Uncharacterized protein n=1 Tax=Cesiribacter andamanensis AMV16 TaxID=1279009 RepID=M7N3I1_9BACT|nr:hypothetical protein [Cesiribacter andamanensis]EMR01847.1 hypothetical protein ADICEAN_03006 [Cesiribacter andamanensis AMV16]
MKSFAALPFLALLLMLGACQPASLESDAPANGEPITAEATLRWTGMLAADGCGFFLDINGKEYKPSNEEAIPESFQQTDSSPVVVTYRLLEKPLEYSCGMMPARFASNLHILEIRPAD